MRLELSLLCGLVPSALAFATTHYGNLGVHDPAIVQNSGKFYAFSTGGLIDYWKSNSIAGPWTHQGTVFSKAPNINHAGSNDLWAPDVHLVGGTYYLYYAASSFGTQNSVIGLATSPNLNVGSWTDHGVVISSSSSAKSPYSITNAIDPNLIIAADGSAHLNWGSFWDDIYQTPMNSALTRPSGATPVHLSVDPADTRPEEGSYINYHGGYYYLWVSHGQCCNFESGVLPAAGKELVFPPHQRTHALHANPCLPDTRFSSVAPRASPVPSSTRVAKT